MQFRLHYTDGFLLETPTTLHKNLPAIASSRINPAKLPAPQRGKTSGRAIALLVGAFLMSDCNCIRLLAQPQPPKATVEFQVIDIYGESLPYKISTFAPT